MDSQPMPLTGNYLYFLLDTRCLDTHYEYTYEDNYLLVNPNPPNHVRN